EPISPDLTRNDPEKLGVSGGVTADNSSAEHYCTVYSISESPLLRGRTWARIDTGLPAEVFTRVVREDPVRPGLLYCGTEAGVHASIDAGQSWFPIQGSLPVVPVHDLVTAGSDLVVATHGRSFWVLDDLTP